ncbi:hypothetical protein [Sphingomonas sp. BK580]|uniref:hypothetical protein n=1 Tax=Sphingomonas sp. BK580 TaxID=2586972 RepID=UPI0016155D18|nr:hypothetical protein [Sphingomonas sp. BK580]MBB3693018.1 hypothetical protein [Sphingomonas sp. BK580]
MAEVETSDGKVLVYAGTPSRCCMALESHEAIDLAQQLIAAAVDVKPAAKFRPGLVRA